MPRPRHDTCPAGRASGLSPSLRLGGCVVPGMPVPCAGRAQAAPSMAHLPSLKIASAINGNNKVQTTQANRTGRKPEK